MRTVTNKELTELLRSNEMVYLLDDTDEIAWGFSVRERTVEEW